MSPSDAEASEQAQPAASRAGRNLPAMPFFAGLLLSFIGCAVAGRWTSQRFMFEDFVRFFSPIQPQRLFFPTATQLVSHVRHVVPKGKTPVIIGGASYFRGTGQNPDEVWSRELQRLLGDRYVVINFGIDGAPLTALAATVFEIVSREFPDALYVANGSPLSGAPWDGGETYQYLFWDAYYKGLLPASVGEAQHIRAFAQTQRRDPALQDLHLGKWIDQFTFACDLWTYVGYRYFFTVWTNEHAREPFRARRLSREGRDPNIRQNQLNMRSNVDYTRSSEGHGRRSAYARYRQDAAGQWRPDKAAWDHLAEEWRNLFPAEFRPRCFVVFLRGNPYFMQTQNEEEKSLTEQQYRLGQANLEREGYQVVQLRAEDFTADDFLDGGHYVASGGVKIAQAVAAKIRAAADARGVAP